MNSATTSTKWSSINAKAGSVMVSPFFVPVRLLRASERFACSESRYSARGHRERPGASQQRQKMAGRKPKDSSILPRIYLILIGSNDTTSVSIAVDPELNLLILSK